MAKNSPQTILCCQGCILEYIVRGRWLRSISVAMTNCNYDFFRNPNLIFPDLSPVASACPSGLIRRHLTPAFRVSPVESRMFFMANEKKYKSLKEDFKRERERESGKENCHHHFLEICEANYSLPRVQQDFWKLGTSGIFLTIFVSSIFSLAPLFILVLSKSIHLLWKAIFLEVYLETCCLKKSY